MAVGDPTGPDLATSTRSLTLDSKAVYTFTFDTPYAVTSGTTYAIVVRRPDADFDDAAEWFYKAGQTATGESKGSTDSGSTWSSVGVGNDFYLITYSAGPTIKDNFSFVVDDGDYDIRSAVWGAQTFQPSSSYTMTAVAVQLADRNRFVNNEPLDVIVSLKATETAASPPSKASNPTPADAATEVSFGTPTLDWDGDGDTYDVRGGAAGNFVLLASGISASTYTLTEQQKTFFKNGVVTWRVDSINDEGTTVGDDWTFDPRPGKASNPGPTNTGTDISLSTQFSWDAGANATTYDYYLDGSIRSNGQAGLTFDLDGDYLQYNTNHNWKVDSVNEYGTTSGDLWTFTGLTFDPMISSWKSIGGGSGPLDGGTAGVDFYWTGINNLITVGRLVAAAKDTFYYESLGED